MKLKKRILLIISIFLVTSNLIGQSNFKESKNKIFFAPLNLFDVINPSVQVGYERILSNKFSFQIEGGLIMKRSVIGFIVTAIDDYPYWFTNKGFKIRSELKYYLWGRNRPYLSGELFYTKNNSNVNDLFIVSDTSFKYPIERPEGTNAYEDFFSQEKQRFGINLKFGLEVGRKNRIVFEPHIGIGIVYRSTEHYNRMNNNDGLLDDVISFSNKRGNMLIFNLPLNFKLGYKFN